MPEGKIVVRTMTGLDSIAIAAARIEEVDTQDHQKAPSPTNTMYSRSHLSPEVPLRSGFGARVVSDYGSDRSTPPSLSSSVCHGFHFPPNILAPAQPRPPVVVAEDSPTNSPPSLLVNGGAHLPAVVKVPSAKQPSGDSSVKAALKAMDDLMISLGMTERSTAEPTPPPEGPALKIMENDVL